MTDGPFRLGYRGVNADLWLGDRLLIDVLGWDASAACLDRAVRRLDEAFHPAGRDMGPDSLDHLLFEGGPFYAKRDGMSGLPMWLYLEELLRTACEITPERRLVLERVAPPVWIAGLRETLGLDITEEPGLPIADPVELYRGERSGAWWMVVQGSLRPLAAKLKGGPRGTRGVPLLMLSLRDWNSHGFGYMVEDIGARFACIGLRPKEKPWRVRFSYPDGAWSCYPGATLSEITRAHLLARRLRTRMAALRAEVAAAEPLVADFLSYRYGSFFATALHFVTLERFLRQRKPAALITSGSYNNPDEVRTNLVCRKLGIPVINVSQRTLSASIPAMLIDYERDRATLADRFVVYRDSSADTLAGWGVPRDRISVGDRALRKGGAGEADTLPALVETGARPAILLMLDDHMANRALVPAVLGGIDPELRLMVRAHPRRPLDEQPDVRAMLDARGWEDVTGKPLDQVVVPGATIGISPCSSVGVDAAQQGAALLWFPQIMGSHALLNQDLLHATGHRCEGPADLARHIADWSDPATCRAMAQAHRDRLAERVAPLHDAVSEQLARAGITGAQP
jgi:hypothetical protein